MNISDAKSAEARHLLQVYSQLDIEPVSAEGVYIHTRQGDRILDLYGGHAVAALGYAHPAIIATITEQSARLFFQSNAVALHERAQAADDLAAFAPDGLERVFFVNSGAEANENALRLALRKTSRTKIVAIEHGFHGRSAAAGAVTWGAAAKWYSFPRAPFDVAFLPRNNSDGIEDTVDNETAAVIVELVQGVAGAFDLDAGFVATLARRCRETGALLIVDEVQTGMGRCGAPFASDLYEVQPDILTVAKALGAGFPCGAMLTTEAVAESVNYGDLGTTFGGGPLACALISTVIRELREHDLPGRVQALSARLRRRCPVGPVTGVQGHGFLLGLRCATSAREVRDQLLRENILVGTSEDPAVIRLLPPLILEDKHVDAFIDALERIG